MAGPNQVPGPSAIRAPTPDIGNHQIVLTQLKETTETAQRIRGNPNDSYVKLGELVNAGVIKYIGGVVSPNNSNIHVKDSITGAGTTASPLELSGDVASPGNNMYYGTNGSGTKGWYASSGGGSSWTITDGTNTVTGVTHLAVTGGTVGGSTPNATLTISGGGGSPGVPATVPDLIFWWQGDVPLSSTGVPLPAMQNSTPWLSGMTAVLTSNTPGATKSSALLNGHGTYDFTNSSQYLIPGSGPLIKQSTVFVVYNPASIGSYQGFLGGQSAGAYQMLVDVSGKLFLGITGGANVFSTGTVAAGTFFQANVTYDNGSGAYAFRISRAASGSGSFSAPAMVVGCSGMGWVPDGGFVLGGSLAELIVYDRVLTGPEITSVENYLFAKWGV